MSDIKALSLACESKTASSSNFNVGSIGLRGLSFTRFGDRGSSTRSLLSFSGEKILSMPSLPASHHMIVRNEWMFVSFFFHIKKKKDFQVIKSFLFKDNRFEMVYFGKYNSFSYMCGRSPRLTKCKCKRNSSLISL